MIRAVAILLTLVTGFAALVYEIVWQRMLAVLLGSHAEAAAVVLGLFLGGLCWGYSLFGRLSRRQAARPGGNPARVLLQAYGMVEAAIGVWALLFPWLFGAVRHVSVALPHGSEWVAFPIDVALAALLVLPPTLLMGATIPLLTQALAGGLADATRFHALVYGFNTAGAFFGAAAAGFFLVPALGLAGVLVAMGVVNLAAGGAYVALGALHRGPAAPAATPAATPATGEPPAVGSFVAVALLVGFALMALQTVVLRVAGLAIGASPFAFSTVVATFVLGIALGSLGVSALDRIPRAVLPASQWALVGYLLALYPAVEDSPYWAHVIRAAFRDLHQLAYLYHLANFAALLLVLLVPLVLSGAALPLIFHRLRREVADLGRVAGRIYSWNTVGSLAGALLGGYALLFWLDLHQIYRLVLLALAAAAALATARSVRRGTALGGALLALAAVVVVALPGWSQRRLAVGTFRTRVPVTGTFEGPEPFFREHLSLLADDDPILFYEDDPTSTVAVIQTRKGGRALMVNGKSDSAIPDDLLTTGLQALIPAMLAERCERAFVVGYGTGVTAGMLAALDSVVEVAVVEISPGVLHAATVFDPLNGTTSTNPKLQISRRDAYRSLLRRPELFDVIVSEPTNPWVAGVEMLYSLDFLTSARERLAPGGVYAQFVHTYEIDDATMALVLNTFRRAFDRVALWIGGPSDLLLVGFESREPRLDLAALERRWSLPDYRAAFEQLDIGTFATFLTHEVLPLGVLHEIELPDDVHTLMRPTLNHRAALAFFAGGHVVLPSSAGRRAAELGRRNSLLGRYRQRLGGRFPDALWPAIVDEACSSEPFTCTAFFARWLHEYPDSPALAAALERARQFESFARPLAPGNLSRVSSLFRADGTRGAEATYEVAERVRETFLAFYHHAVPFDARALHEPWQRCAADPRCQQQLSEVLETGTIPDGPEP